MAGSFFLMTDQRWSVAWTTASCTVGTSSLPGCVGRRFSFEVGDGMAGLERSTIRVGFIPIIDCAAIVLAEETSLAWGAAVTGEIHSEATLVPAEVSIANSMGQFSQAGP